jgi:hypothetical protein
LAWVYQKVDAIMKEWEKNFSSYCSAKKMGTFFRKEVLRKMCEKSNAKRKSRKGLTR